MEKRRKCWEAALLAAEEKPGHEFVKDITEEMPCWFNTEHDCYFSIGSMEEKFTCGGFPGKVSNFKFETFMISLISFRKPISSVKFQTSNSLLEVIPSSNACSPTDTEEPFLLMKNGFKEDSTQDKYLKIYNATEFKEPGQEFGEPSNGRSNCINIPSYLQLREVLNLAPVTVEDEDLCKQVIREDLKAEMTYKIEISKYCAIPQEVCSSISTNMLEFCESEPSREFLESLVWQSEKYRDNMRSLLLVEHPSVNLAHQHHSLAELRKELPVEVEAPMLGSLEEVWWLHKGLNPAAVEILEQFNMDGSNPNSLLPTEVETFTQFTSYQIERWLEEKNSVTNQELFSAERHQSEKVVNPNLSLQIQRQYFDMSAVSSAKIHSTNTSVEELTGGSIRKIKTEEAVHFLNQEKETPKPSEQDSCKGGCSKLDNSSCSGKRASPASKRANDDSDLNNFIMMRSRRTNITQREEKYYVDRPEKLVQLEEQLMHVHKEDDFFCETVKTEEKTQEKEDSITVNIKPSESQCQAYCLLEEAAIPVLKDLTHLGVLGSVTWSFDSVKFDHTRFFLKQQEKVICDNFKQGKIDEKEIMLFRHAALVHLLVTVRDLLLTCGLETVLGYLSKAKDIYKDILESCLNNIWRQLKIVQYSSQKKHETHPKITALQCELLKWMKSYGENHSVKSPVLEDCDYGIIPAELIWELLLHLDVQTYNAHGIHPRVLKELKNVIILIITRMDSEKAAFIHPLSRIEDFQDMYVIILYHVLAIYLAIRYSIAFVERRSSYSLKLFGSTDRYVVLTIDECTAIFLQGMEELNCEDSCDTVISRLMALSLQYMCCWIIFYSRERLNLEYSLKGNTLLNLVLIYATLIELTQKSEDFEVKSRNLESRKSVLAFRKIIIKNGQKFHSAYQRIQKHYKAGIGLAFQEWVIG
ncbi:hypothetical protein TURU_010857 [Turdus rufiventris]|nr:hypothetical protein TURU_010857 [Turdus rufiventris]